MSEPELASELSRPGIALALVVAALYGAMVGAVIASAIWLAFA